MRPRREEEEMNMKARKKDPARRQADRYDRVDWYLTAKARRLAESGETNGQEKQRDECRQRDHGV